MPKAATAAANMACTSASCETSAWTGKAVPPADSIVGDDRRGGAGADIVHHHLRSGGGQLDGDGPADAGAGAGDDGGLAGQTCGRGSRGATRARQASAWAGVLPLMMKPHTVASVRGWSSSATSPVQPVWCAAPTPRPLSPWKYSWNSTWSRKCGSSWCKALVAEARAPSVGAAQEQAAEAARTARPRPPGG